MKGQFEIYMGGFDSSDLYMVSLKYIWVVGFIYGGYNVCSFIFLNTWNTTSNLKGLSKGVLGTL
jgi:hypothetical protein